ncbi:hypothetical protein AB1Y20_021053 [Prymnesium parvum]|uniref:F-box domain-containing protein n=1 Tax=Prymnesium parvum TaxID=97485 RepID=A0AB34JKF0_PRYPA
MPPPAANDTASPPANALHRLSDDDLSSILCACTARTLCTLQEVSTALRAAASAEPVWRRLLARECGLPLAEPLPCEARQLYRHFLSPPASLPALGFLTDGGLDNTISFANAGHDEGNAHARLVEQLHIAPPRDATAAPLPRPAVIQLDQGASFWVRKAFEPTDWEVYCSEEKMTNIVLAAAMLPPSAVHVDVEQERRAFLIDHLDFAARQVWGLDDGGTMDLRALHTETLEQALLSTWMLDDGVEILLFDVHPDHREEHEERLRSMVQEIQSPTRNQLTVLSLPVVTNTGERRLLLLDAKVAPTAKELSRCNAEELLAAVMPPASLVVATSVIIRRAMSCSCPVQSGVVFGSRKPLTCGDLWGETAAVFKDVTTLEQVLELQCAATAAVERRGNGCFVEIPRKPSWELEDVFPILWFRFDEIPMGSFGSTEMGSLQCNLRQRRSLRYLMVLLIDSENRMQAMGDDHSDTNIDIEFCGVHGWHV